MAASFRNALISHMEAEGTTINALCAATGVSRDVIAKVRSRERASTTVENAMKIAAFYGKSVEEFISGAEVSPQSALAQMVTLLDPQERDILLRQLRGMVARAG